MKILSNRPICLYIAMRLSIYSDSFTCGDYLLKIPRLVSWYQSHGLGLGLGYSNSPTIQFFFTLGSILSLRGVVRLVCSAHRRTSAPFARPVGSFSTFARPVVPSVADSPRRPCGPPPRVNSRDSSIRASRSSAR